MYKPHRLFEWCLIAVVVLCAIFIRTYRIWDRGLINHDEGYYANSAKTPYYVVRWIFEDRELHENTSLRSFLESYGCSNPKDKPGHIFLLSLGFIAFGMRDVSPILTSAIFGILSVIWVYWFGRKRLGFTWTIFSMAILSVSFLHIHYSRSALYISSVFP